MARDGIDPALDTFQAHTAIAIGIEALEKGPLHVDAANSVAGALTLGVRQAVVANALYTINLWAGA
jgi:hypothetical protein